MNVAKAEAPTKMATQKALPPEELLLEDQGITQSMTARMKD
jgi:hypothetical protein